MKVFVKILESRNDSEEFALSLPSWDDDDLEVISKRLTSFIENWWMDREYKRQKEQVSRTVEYQRRTGKDLDDIVYSSITFRPSTIRWRYKLRNLVAFKEGSYIVIFEPIEGLPEEQEDEELERRLAEVRFYQQPSGELYDEPAHDGQFTSVTLPDEVESACEPWPARIPKKASLNRLVLKLTDHSVDEQFIKVFVGAFRYFSTPLEVLQKLLERYHIPDNDDSHSSFMDDEYYHYEVRVRVQLAVLRVLHEWLSVAAIDFSETMLQELKQFLELRVSEDGHTAVVAELVTLVEQRLYNLKFNIQRSVPSKTEVFSRASTARVIFDFSAQELAEQLTAMDFEYYTALSYFEFLNRPWKQPKNLHSVSALQRRAAENGGENGRLAPPASGIGLAEVAPNLDRSLQHFRSTVEWVCTVILNEEDLAKRKRAAELLIHTMMILKNMRNYNTLVAMYVAFNAPAIIRLTWTHDALKREELAALDELDELMNAGGGFFNLRQEMGDARVRPPTPCIPHIGVYLADIDVLENGHRLYTPDGRINFQRFPEIYAVIDTMLRFQKCDYGIKKSAEFERFFYTHERMDNVTMYSTSLALEARGSEKKRAARTRMTKQFYVEELVEQLKQQRQERIIKRMSPQEILNMEIRTLVGPRRVWCSRQNPETEDFQLMHVVSEDENGLPGSDAEGGDASAEQKAEKEKEANADLWKDQSSIAKWTRELPTFLVPAEKLRSEGDENGFSLTGKSVTLRLRVQGHEATNAAIYPASTLADDVCASAIAFVQKKQGTSVLKPNTAYLLKVTGLYSFLTGKIPIGHFEVVYDSLLSSAGDILEIPDISLVPANEFLEPVVASVRAGVGKPVTELVPRPFELARRYGEEGDDGASAVMKYSDEVGTVSLRVRVESVHRLSLRALPGALLTKNIELVEQIGLIAVEIALYVDNLSRPIRDPVYSVAKPATSDIRWPTAEAILDTRYPLSCLHPDTVMGISLYTVKAGRSPADAVTRSRLGSCIGTRFLSLFDHKRTLRRGRTVVSLWNAENPVSICVDNHSTTSAIDVAVCFDFGNLVVEGAVAPLVVARDADELPEERLHEFQVDVASPTISYKGMENRLAALMEKDSLYPLTADDRQIIWHLKNYILRSPTYRTKMGQILPKLLLSVDWTHVQITREAYSLILNPSTSELLQPLEALALLDSVFFDHRVREYAVQKLEDLTDDELVDFMLQLVQVLKHEKTHDSALARFLMRRALQSPHTVGHFFFWHLKAEMHLPEIRERYGLLLEEYLRYCGYHRKELSKQNSVVQQLCAVADLVKCVPKDERKAMLMDELESLTLPERFGLPLSPTIQCKGIRIEKCKCMDSKKVPLWLVFENADPDGDPIFVIFKAGDDLRQDALTLQMIRIMDRLWKAEGLELHMNPYDCVATGDEEGLLQIVLKSDTTAAISRKYGGTSGALKKSPMLDYLRENTESDSDLKIAKRRFLKSCAAYCVATYVLGIGDRHNDNVMLKKNGELFHIDFGHFLGNYKKKFGMKRERAPFVFTPDFAYVLDGEGSPMYKEFEQLCIRAYNIIRKHGHLFITLFRLMIPTGLPELTKLEDLMYLRKALCLQSTDEQAGQHFKNLIAKALSCKTTQINNMIHMLAH